MPHNVDSISSIEYRYLLRNNCIVVILLINPYYSALERVFRNGIKMQSFKKLISQYMQQHKIGDAELAEKLGIQRQTIFRWRKGTIKSPNCDLVRQCTELFELSDTQRYELLTSAGFPDLQAAMPISQTKTPTVVNEQTCVPVVTRPISQPCQFFGQTKLLQRIYEAWNKQAVVEHVSVVGERRAGKTSLLNYLYFIHTNANSKLRDTQQILSKPYQWILLDFENLKIQYPKHLLIDMLRQLNVKADTNADLIDLTIQLEENLQQPTIILMDNIEKGLQSQHLDATIWDYLRHLGEHGASGQIGFCSASRYSIEELESIANEQGKTSPFSNVFETLNIKPFTESETQELLSYAPRQLDAEDIAWIWEKSQGWAVLVQILCKVALDKQEYGQQWQQMGLKKIKSYQYLLDPS